MLRLIVALLPKFSLAAISTAPPHRVVMKFGGSSVRDAERIAEVSRLVSRLVDELGIQPCLVCSAMGKTTNALISASERALSEGVVDLSVTRRLHETTMATLGVRSSAFGEEILGLLDQCERTLEGVSLLGELSLSTRDLVVSFGERMSGRMVAAQLNEIGLRSMQYEAWDIGLLTNAEFGEASVLESSWSRISEHMNAMDQAVVPVITGFIGKESGGRITTLGRGGSDLTASLIGAAAGFDEVQVWKDVDGILTADPRLCPLAQPVPTVTFEEAAELAYFGAQVLHPLAMMPARRTSTPFRVKNSYNPAAEGTLIQEKRVARSLVSAITSKDGVQLVDIVSTRMLGQYGFLAKVFDSFAKHQISVDVIASSEVSVSLTLNKEQVIPRKERGEELDDTSPQFQGLLDDLNEVADVMVSGGHSILTLISDVRRSSSVVAVVSAVMAKLGVPIEMISQGASKVNVSLVVPQEHSAKAVQALHSCFFEGICVVPLPDLLPGLSVETAKKER
mmetsp:Transcript_44800/g.74344  ORF Transcript_44800/g.74344 Transcript_44800/m.74344 type:complete len:508 (+) Transcript_44800:22-1545(+)